MFHNPWFLTLLAIVPFVGWLMWRTGRLPSINFSSAASDWSVPPTLKQRLLWLPSVLTLMAITLMIVSLARPRHGREQTMISSEGIAIEMVVDRSGSMRALDFEIDGRNVDRLTAIKNVASKFVLGENDASNEQPLEGRVNDLIGLITFAGYADAVTPLTLDHSFLVQTLDRTKIVSQRREDGTAIGDALSLAVDKLNSLDGRQKETIQSKIIILLTDGENTAGEIEPNVAAELAETMGIKIYTIGVGTRGVAPFPIRRLPNGRVVIRNEYVNIDEEALRAIAASTGGKYFRATDTKSLEAIYEEIDQLEKTEVEALQFVDYKELAVQTVRLGGVRVPPLLWIAFLLLAARLALTHTFLRRLA